MGCNHLTVLFEAWIATNSRCSHRLQVIEHRQRCTDDDVMRTVQKVLALEDSGAIPPWHEADAPDHLMDTEALPEPGVIVGERQWDSLGATELTLGNGMRICFKSTPHMNDEVLITGFAFGGLSEVPVDLLNSACMARSIAGELGMFGFKPIVLTDILAGAMVRSPPYQV